eukprot:TRINITY_DN4039_c0_g1_i1.p1 TRINITY_DN4039_c0_g1~~TRINITY_DN4039_c0_g1_i1.p1  ORF type:complete len:163 (+),score=34.85 TRINITY_DN4039_c0_g1_i1:70-558(+)
MATTTPSKDTSKEKKGKEEKAYYPATIEYASRDFGLTGAVLYAANEVLGARCSAVFDDFTLCKGKYENPEKCLKEGESVSKCAIETFQEIGKLCQKELTVYATCLDKKNMDFNNCRKEQLEFKTCSLPLYKLSSSIEVPSPEQQYKNLLQRIRSPVTAPPKD